MKRKYDYAHNLTISELNEHKKILEKAIDLCEKHKNAYFFHGYSRKNRQVHEDKNSMSAHFVVYTLGDLEIDISTTYSNANTYFKPIFMLNDERKDLRIARKALKIIVNQISIKIELKLY